MIERMLEREVLEGGLVAVTLDVDWAPDFVIDGVAARLIESGVKATWFVTHRSAAVERLRARPELFELGIHPNFRPGSTHGASEEEVLRHCLEIVPEALSMRTHSLVQSSPMLAMLRAATRVRTDVSLFLPHHPGLQPVHLRTDSGPLLRIPFFWEDDAEMLEPAPDWKPQSLTDGVDGLKVFNFHPIHVYLNSPDMGAYCALKAASPSILELRETYAREFRHQGAGTGTAFECVLGHLARTTGGATITGIADRWNSLAVPAGRSAGVEA